MIEILRRAMHSIPDRPSSEDIREWREDPVTQYLFAELVTDVLEQLTEDLPKDSERAICIAFEREGARKMLDELWQWGRVWEEEDET
jgi:uncharacterized phage-associated protein